MADRLRELKQLGLRDLRPLELPDPTPEGLELATGLRGGDRPVVVVATRTGDLDAIGWALVAAHHADRHGAEEIVIAAPAFGPSVRRAAATLAETPGGLPIRLVTAPGLVQDGAGPVVQERFPEHDEAGPMALLGRVVRVIEGAATVTCAGTLQRFEDGYILYMRGLRALRLEPEGDGVAVTFLDPENRHIHVTDTNFPRWGLELHDAIVQLAQDPRLLERDEEQLEHAADAAAAAAGARITSRCVPWNRDGSDPLPWVGIDGDGRPVVGVLEPRLRGVDVPAIVAGVLAVGERLGAYMPGARGRLRLVVSGESLDARVRGVLELLDVSVESRSLGDLAESAEGRDRPPRRRRPRRRRRPEALDAASSDEGELDEGAGEPIEAGAPDREPDAEPSVRSRRGRGSRGRRQGGDRGGASERSRDSRRDDRRAGGEGRDLAAPEGGAEVLEERQAGALVLGPPVGEREAGAEREPEAEGEAAETTAAAAEALEVGASDEEEAAPAHVAALGADDADDGEEPEAEPEPAVVEPPRRKRPRAAICVRNDPDAVLAALVLARERRHIPFFYVCAQEDLNDFLRGKATDLEENADLLMVGFSLEPIPRDTIAVAEPFRDRLQWLDAHGWPVEDVESLRAAIGADAVVVADGASSPLAAVMEVCERRSRFTDKLIDLAGRRLSENDMEKWGYRLVGLLQRLAGARGDQRSSVSPVLQGKPADLPAADSVYQGEKAWLEEHDPRMVYFGEYQMAVVQVPSELDAGEIARRARLRTGARLSLATRDGDTLAILGSNEEKRPINVMGMVDKIDSHMEWAHARPGGDRVGRFQVDALQEHPERIETVIGEIARSHSVLYG